MDSREINHGRSFAVTFDHGDDFMTSLADFCTAHNVRSGYISWFLAGFAAVEIVGTCQRLTDPNAPVWDKVHLTGVEAIGAGSLAWDPDAGVVAPHIHVAVGEKARSANGSVSHLLSAEIAFTAELVVHEVSSPMLQRKRNPDLYDVPLLQFGPVPSQ